MFSVHTSPREFETDGGVTLKTHQMFSVHTSPEEFENGGFTLKTHQMISVLALRRRKRKRRFHYAENTSNVFRPGTSPEKFVNGGFTKRKPIKWFPSTLRRRNLKTEVSLWRRITEMFSAYALDKFEDTTITGGHFGFVFEENLGGKITTPSCSRSYVLKMFSVRTEWAQSPRFQIAPVWKALSKARFSWRISVTECVTDGTPNRRNQAEFSKFSGEVWKEPKTISLGGYNCLS